MQNLHLLGTGGDTNSPKTMTLLSTPSHTIRLETWRSESLKNKEKKSLLTKKDSGGSKKSRDGVKAKNDNADDDDDDNIQEIQIEIPLAYVNKWNKNNNKTNTTATATQQQSQQQQQQKTPTFAHTMV